MLGHAVKLLDHKCCGLFLGQETELFMLTRHPASNLEIEPRTIHMKTIEKCFHMVLFIMMYKVNLTFESG